MARATQTYTQAQREQIAEKLIGATITKALENEDGTSFGFVCENPTTISPKNGEQSEKTSGKQAG